MIDLTVLLNEALGEGTWVAYCINLERAASRRELFSQWAKSINLPFEWWIATDKNKLTEDDRKMCNVHYGDGASACRISHHKLCKHLLSTYANTNVKWFFFLEDDAGFKNPRADAQMLKNFLIDVSVYRGKLPFEMLHFGYHDTGMKQLRPISANTQHVMATHLTHAMMLSLRTVRNVDMLCEQADLKHLPIDWIVDALRKSKVDTCAVGEAPTALTLGPSVTAIHQVDEHSYIWEK
jgi:hypothetical protein